MQELVPPRPVSYDDEPGELSSSRCIRCGKKLRKPENPTAEKTPLCFWCGYVEPQG